MRLWTTQPATILEELRTNGVYRCDPTKSYNLVKGNDLKEQYRWLMEQMKVKIGPAPEGVTYPIWAWHSWNFEHQMPDPNSAAFLKRESAGVVLTLEIPEERVVLTDYEAWNYVMNDWLLTDVTDEAEYDRILEWYDNLSEDEQEIEKRKSWMNVFKIDRIETDLLTRGKFVQATFWELRKEDIVEQKLLPGEAEGKA